MLAEATSVLIATARNANSSEEQVNAAAQSFFADAAKASKTENDAALRSIARHFDLENPSRSAFLALVCGVLVERGGDPLTISGPLTAGLAPLLAAAGELVDACLARLPATSSAATDEQDQSAAFEKALSEVSPAMPSQMAAWQALDQFWHPAIAVYSTSTAARHSAQSLRDLTAKISQYHAAGHWLGLILTVLDRAPILVIEPATSAGMLGRISGIVDNFQLNTLLMDTFPDGQSSHRRVSKDAAAVARGIGPQEQDGTVSSVWNLYTWQAVQADLRLPDAANYGASDFWVWNEGVPADIPTFEGYRVILLGPQSYPRSWPSQRMFGSLSANLECERQLTPEEIDGWLRRMVAANH